MDDRMGALPLVWSVLIGVGLLSIIVHGVYRVWRDLRADGERRVSERQGSSSWGCDDV